MIGIDTTEFNVAIDRFVALAKGRTRAFAIEFIQDMNQAIVANPQHPVDTGFLRGSWYAQLNSRPAGTRGVTDKSGAGAIARVNLIAAQLKLGDVYYMVNGANYAVFVEFGTERTAPRAFVRGPLSRANSIAEAAARRVAAR